MNRSPGVLSPTKTSDGRSSESPDEEEETFATRAREEMSETKVGSKFVRVLTVMAYVLCVSMAAILLSLYYVLVWDPPKHIHEDPQSPSALRDERDRMEMDYILLNKSFRMEDYYNHQKGQHGKLDKSATKVSISSILEDRVFTTPNTSFDYEEKDKSLVEVPEYEDTFNNLNNTLDKTKKYSTNNLTRDINENYIIKRLQDMMYNSTMNSDD